MFVSVRGAVTLAMMGVAFTGANLATAQSREFQACSTGALSNCAGIRLLSQLGVGPSNTNRIDIGIQNLGSQAMPGIATSIYFASFATGQIEALDVVDELVAPVAQNGATVSDATPWSLFENGETIFLSPTGNNGIGGCVFGAPSGGFGLMGQTCGLNQFITFSFFTTRAFDLNAFALSGLEFVALDANNTADSCNDATPCRISGVSTVPEPSSIVLLIAGCSAILALRSRRQIRGI